MTIPLSNDLAYLALFSLVLIVPKMLLRFKIPSGIAALCIGIVAGYYLPEVKDDQLFRFLSQIGITSLFVFAGLEVNFQELKDDRVYLTKYLTKTLVVVFLIAAVLGYYFGLSFQNALIFSLGIFTPSAGFIMNSLHSFNIDEDQEYWVKSKAISKEIVSILLLFVALQGGNLKQMGLSLAFFVGLFVFLPLIFRWFFKRVSPYAPNMEVPFLVVLSLISGVISKELGAYYLVGAFAVGLIGSKFKHEIFKEDEETLFKSLSSFFNVFLPFYFFYAGTKIVVGDLGWNSFLIAIGLFALFVPFRIWIIRASIKYLLKEQPNSGYAISLSLMPTLIFGLVIAFVLKERGEVDPSLVYALIIYTLLTSLLPSIIFSLRKAKALTTEA